MLVLHNTRTGRLERFEPQQQGLVRLYVCGPTVYDFAHVGHARSYLVWDTLKRHLRLRGQHVCHVQNFTDVDERITKKAQAQGMQPLALSSAFIDSYHQDMDWLGVLRADYYPRTTDHVQQCIEMAQALVANGRAYAADGDVYLSWATARDLTSLTALPLEQSLCGAVEAVNPRKRDPFDVAVWKSGQGWEVTWDSPWGAGRPGWHTECAAMATAYLGPTLDLHAGGLDLIFPHHDSETRIAEACTGTRYCRFYLHNGFVTADSVKMSKSRGNFVTVHELRTHGYNGLPVEPSTLRLMLLSAHYRSTIDFTGGLLTLARVRLQRLRRAWAHLAELEGAAPPTTDAEIDGLLASLRPQLGMAMDHDLDTPRALGVALEVAALVLEAKELGPQGRVMARDLLQHCALLFGLSLQPQGPLATPPGVPPPPGWQPPPVPAHRIAGA